MQIISVVQVIVYMVLVTMRRLLGSCGWDKVIITCMHKVGIFIMQVFTSSVLVHKGKGGGECYYTRQACSFGQKYLKKDKLGDFPAKALPSNSRTKPKLQNLHWSAISHMG